MQIKKQPDLSRFSSLHIGGVGNFLYLPETEAELDELIGDRSDFLLIGGGTNVVFSDSFTQDILSLRRFGAMEVDITGKTISAAAGVKLSRIVYEGSRAGISGLEALAGIPGTLGGAVCMNAGSKYGCIADYIKTVRVFSLNSGQVEVFTREELQFSYRHSLLQETDNYIVLSAELEFSGRVDPAESISLIKNIIHERVASKIKLPNCGSAFKNPVHELSAGVMIDRLGLKGKMIGDIGVSTEHGNIIVNHGQGVFQEFSSLISLIREKVSAEYDVNLELEIRVL